MAEAQVQEALVLAATVNELPDGALGRLHEIAQRLADGAPEPTLGYAIEFRCPEDGAEVSVWLTLGRVGPATGALLGSGGKV